MGTTTTIRNTKDLLSGGLDRRVPARILERQLRRFWLRLQVWSKWYILYKYFTIQPSYTVLVGSADICTIGSVPVASEVLASGSTTKSMSMATSLTNAAIPCCSVSSC